MRLPWACLVRAHAWLCAQASCAGRQPRSSAVYPILCSLRLVDRAPTAVVLMRLADYCCPSPTSTSPPFLSGRQPCRPSVANPAQAGLGRTIDTHTLKYFAVCVFSPCCVNVWHTCAARGPRWRQEIFPEAIQAEMTDERHLLLLLLNLSHFLILHLRILICHQEALRNWEFIFSHVPPSARLFP